MLRANWTTTRIADVVNNRCSSLPPTNLEYYDHVSGPLLNSNTSSELANSDVEQVTYSRLKSQASIEVHGATMIHVKDTFATYVPPADFSRINPDVHPTSTRTNKSSPSDCSVITDEDSGYDPTMYTFGRPNGSTSSITNSGPLVSDNSSLGFVNRDELLHVMTEDLVEWFVQLYPNLTEELDVDNFFDRLSDGVLLCHHAKEIHQRLNEQCVRAGKDDRVMLTGIKVGGFQATLPSICPVYQTRGLQSSTAASGFVSRDNVSNFLVWCRQLGMPDSVLFETEDLVCRKNPRNVAICLLELARLGGLMGIAVPGLIELEVEIDQELAVHGDSSVGLRKQHSSSSCSSITEQEYVLYAKQTADDPNTMISDMGKEKGDRPLDDVDGHSGCSYKTTRSTQLRRIKNQGNSLNRGYRSDSKWVEEDVKRRPEIKRPIVDMRSLDEIVRDLLSQCTCKQTFPMIRVGEGRYLFGDKCTQIFVRILRSHVMVRVGGGWDTLNHFLAKYDECRKTNPPNCRVLPEIPLSTSTTTSTVDTSNVEEVLACVNSSNPKTAICSSDSQIRGQGSLTAVKRSPPRMMIQNGPGLTAECGVSCLKTGGDLFVNGVRKAKDLEHVQTDKILKNVSKPSRGNANQVENSSNSLAFQSSSLKQQPQNCSVKAQTACISNQHESTLKTASFVRNTRSNSAVLKAVKREKQPASATEAIGQHRKVSSNTKASVRSAFCSPKSEKAHGSNKLQASMSKSIDDLRVFGPQVKHSDTTSKNDGGFLSARPQFVQPCLRVASNKPTLTKSPAKRSTNALMINDNTLQTISCSPSRGELQPPCEVFKLANAQKFPNTVTNRPYVTRKLKSIQSEVMAPFPVDGNSKDTVAGQSVKRNLHRGSLIPRPVRCDSISRISTEPSVHSTQLSDV